MIAEGAQGSRPYKCEVWPMHAIQQVETEAAGHSNCGQEGWDLRTQDGTLQWNLLSAPSLHGIAGNLPGEPAQKTMLLLARVCDIWRETVNGA